MQFLRSSSFTSVVLFSLFQIFTLAAANIIDIGKLQVVPRQATTSCAEYASIANFSAIDANSTFRAAFLQSSPQGTDPTSAILNDATKKLPTVIFDKTLNAQCGNLTAIALQEAPKNFSMGIVGAFTIKKTANAGVRVGGSSEMGTVLLVAMMVGAGLLL